MERKVNFQMTVEHRLGSPKTALVVGRNGDLRKVFLKIRQFCTEKMVNQKRVYVVLDPQPISESILENQRCYSL